MALDAKEMHVLISHIEERTKGLVYDRALLNSTLRDVYRSRDYLIRDRGYGMMMFKPLTGDASFKRIYGDKFYPSLLDVFLPSLNSKLNYSGFAFDCVKQCKG